MPSLHPFPFLMIFKSYWNWIDAQCSLALIYPFLYPPTYMPTLGLTCAHHHAKWVSWVASVSPSGVESVSINCAYVPPLPNPTPADITHTSPWNKHQTPCKPCTKQDLWNQTWYSFTINCSIMPQGHFVLQLYTINIAGYVFTGLLVPKCIKLPTFFVYDRLNIPDLIHFSGTDFMWVLWYRLLPQSWLCASSNCMPILIRPQTGSRFHCCNIAYMVAVESSGRISIPNNLSFVTLVICTKLNNCICGCRSWSM